MLRRSIRFTGLYLLLTAGAFAQNNRSAVSVNGSDMNLCTTTSPCRSFSAAMTQTNPGGEIIALDSAGYGPFTIDKAITVSGAPGVHAAISVSSGNGINVYANASDRVVIRNLVIIGAAADVGIEVFSAAETRIIGCLVRGFNIGIDFVGGNIAIHRTSVLDNTGFFGTGTGIRLANVGFIIATAHAVVTDCSLQGNYLGISVQANTDAVVSDSTITNNSIGASAVSTLGTGQEGTAALMLERCTLSHHVNGYGVTTNATGGNYQATVYLSQNVIAYNFQGVFRQNSAVVYSFGNNRFAGNTFADGGPFTAAVFK